MTGRETSLIARTNLEKKTWRGEGLGQGEENGRPRRFYLILNEPFARWHHLLLRPESFRVFLSCANYAFCHLNLPGITKFKYEKKNERDSGLSSKMTPSCKWPIIVFDWNRKSWLAWAQLFEGRLALTRCQILLRVFFFSLCWKAF